MSLEFLDSAPHNMTIVDSMVKCSSLISSHDKILASISGGSDSDVLLDMFIQCGGKEKTTFVFFNTGLEYNATKKHLQYLREKYGVEIHEVPPIKPIPVCVRDYGVPFWSKYVSEMISRLQRHGFMWEDEPYETLIVKYPKCSSALKWWCNSHQRDDGEMSNFNIGYVPYLKEFIISNPPKFKISNKCCHYAKKAPGKKYLSENDFDMNCIGVRKAEGGVRSTRYKNCFTQSCGGADQYRPLFWLSDADKAEYEAHYEIIHSDCYKVWGMDRTGCAGCPFSKYWENEIHLVEKYEPKFYKAIQKIFGESYEYRKQFEIFREEMRRKNQ